MDAGEKEFQEALFESIFNYSDNAILTKTLDGVITSLNRAAEQMFGYTPGEIIGQNISILIPANRTQEEADIIEKIKKGILIRQYETERLRKDGCIIDISITVSPLKDKSGNIIGVSKIAHDITAQKKMHENLIRSLKEVADYKYVLDKSSIVAITDQKGIIIYANDNFCKISRYSREELLGQDHRIVNSGHHEKSFIRELWVTIANGDVWRGEIKNRAKDGSYYWVDTTIVPILNENKKPHMYVAIRSDISERKKLELQEKKIAADLLQNNSDLRQFAYIVSHNLRGPVATILGISNCLEDEDVTEEEKNMFIDGIIESVRKLDTVIFDLNNIMDIKNAVSEKKEVVYFSVILSDVISVVQKGMDDKLSTIKCDFSEAEYIIGLKSYMYSIFYNLVSNSVKYRQLNTPLAIEITSKKTEGKITLRFKDNGIGIDLHRKRDQVFNLYKRFHPQYAEGKGIGLYMVKTQVESMGGRISIESEVNVGTIFCIDFDIRELDN